MNLQPIVVGGRLAGGQIFKYEANTQTWEEARGAVSGAHPDAKVILAVVPRHSQQPEAA